MISNKIFEILRYLMTSRRSTKRIHLEDQMDVEVMYRICGVLVVIKDNIQYIKNFFILE